MKKIMTVMGAMMTGCAMAVVPGAWNTNFTNSLACAEKHNIPIVVVWGNMSCSQCTSLHNVLNDSAIMEWAKVHPIIMVDRYEEWHQKIEDYSPDHQAAYYWIKGIDSSLSVLPKVGVYWKKADGTVKCSQAFAGRDGSMPATSGTLAQQLANSLDQLVGEYVPLPERGIIISFVAPNGESSMERAYFATNRPYGRLPLARREGCTFAGWYTSLDGTERVGAFDEVLPDVKTLYARWAEDEAPLYAQWDPNHYSAVFNPDGGTGEMEAQPFIYDQRQALTANAFKKTGYTFKGWATNEAGEVVYADQQVVSNLTAEAGFAVALFAKWEQIMDITEEEIEEWVAYDLAQTYKKPGEKAIDYVKRFKERFGDDYTKAFYAETGKIGQDGTALCVYHDYIAGTDPLDKDSQFTASITFDASGKPVITYKPVLDKEKAAKRIYTTYGKANLTDKDWSVVQPGQEADYRFFKVTIEMRPKN